MNTSKVNEFEARDLFSILNQYKWLILLVSFLFLFLSNVYLYFNPPIYSTHGIIEVKTYDKNARLTDDLLQKTFYSTNKEIDKEIELFKIFDINKLIIEDMNFKIKVFVKDEYRKVELYGDNNPLKFKNITIDNSEIIDKMIKIIPTENGFSLEIEHTLIDKLLSTIFNKELLSFKNKKSFSYGDIAKTDFFKISIEKIEEFTEPLYFKFSGDTRTVFDDIIKNKLIIKQINTKAPLISISYEDNIPERAVSYVDKLIKQFLEKEMIQKRYKSSKMLTVITKQLEGTEKKLRDSEDELERYKVENNIINPSRQTDVIISEISKVSIKVSELKIKIDFFNNMIEILNSGESLDSISPFLIEVNDRATLMLLSQLEKLKSKAEELQLEYTEEYPELLTLRQKIEVIRQKIFTNVDSMQSILKRKISELENREIEQKDTILKFPKNEIKLINLTRSYEVNSEMYAYLLKKKSEQELVNSAVISDYIYVDKPFIDKKPIKPKRMLIIGVFLLLGLSIGVVMAMILSRLSNKIKTVEDIENHTDIPLYGAISFSNRVKNGKIEVFINSQSKFTESFRKLRTDLQFLLNSNKSSTILVTSMLTRGGKSTVASNLSAIFQLAGYKAIIIDLDLRSPVLGRYFDIDVVGMSEYLSGKENLSDIIFSTIYPNLDIISAGAVPINPSELILSDRLEVMLKNLKDKYDYIIIDSTPIETSTDTLNIMKYVDISLVILHSKSVKKSYIIKLEKLISKYKLQNIGLVLNAVKY